MKQNSENTEDLDRDQAEENNYMNGNAAPIGQSTQLNAPNVEAPDDAPQ